MSQMKCVVLRARHRASGGLGLDVLRQRFAPFTGLLLWERQAPKQRVALYDIAHGRHTRVLQPEAQSVDCLIRVDCCKIPEDGLLEVVVGEGSRAYRYLKSVDVKNLDLGLLHVQAVSCGGELALVACRGRAYQIAGRRFMGAQPKGSRGGGESVYPSPRTEVAEGAGCAQRLSAGPLADAQVGWLRWHIDGA